MKNITVNKKEIENYKQTFIDSLCSKCEDITIYKHIDHKHIIKSHYINL